MVMLVPNSEEYPQCCSGLMMSVRVEAIMVHDRGLRPKLFAFNMYIDEPLASHQASLEVHRCWRPFERVASTSNDFWV